MAGYGEMMGKALPGTGDALWDRQRLTDCGLGGRGSDQGEGGGVDWGEIRRALLCCLKEFGFN